MTGSDQSAEILAQLFEVIESRRDRDVGSSYTAKLFASGTEKIAQKIWLTIWLETRVDT